MAQLVYPHQTRHFMSLCDKYPVPIQKAGAIMQMMGQEFFSYNRVDEDSDSSYSAESTISYSETITENVHKKFGHSTFSLNDYCKISTKMDDIMIEVHNIGLIPASEWAPQSISLKDLRKNYFVKKNGACRQFDIKLYNALLITKNYPETIDFIGVSWVNNTTFKVNEKVFEDFFGLKMIFQKQGCFNRYSFEEVYKNQDFHIIQNNPVQEEGIHYFRDTLKRFSRDKKYSCVLN